MKYGLSSCYDESGCQQNNKSIMQIQKTRQLNASSAHIQKYVKNKIHLRIENDATFHSSICLRSNGMRNKINGRINII